MPYHHCRCALRGDHGLRTVGRGAVAVATFALMTAVAGGVAAAHLVAPAPLASAVLQAREQTPVAGVQDEPAAPAARTDGFDPATCHPQPRLPAAPAGAAPDPGAQATVLLTITVPPTTRIVVDDLGRPVAVSTNTGQAPCIADQFLRLAPDGTASPADQELSTAVLRAARRRLAARRPAAPRRPLTRHRRSLDPAPACRIVTGSHRAVCRTGLG